VAPQHQQVASTSSEVQEIDFTPEPELFDPAELQQEIWSAIHPNG
jgi:hypothetical protein